MSPAPSPKLLTEFGVRQPGANLPPQLTRITQPQQPPPQRSPQPQAANAPAQPRPKPAPQPQPKKRICAQDGYRVPCPQDRP